MHAMDVIQASTSYLNPGQIPIIAMDQPLYAIAKQIQWKWSDQYGERKFVIMFGGLHLGIAFLKLLGGWLEGARKDNCTNERRCCLGGNSRLVSQSIKCLSYEACTANHSNQLVPSTSNTKYHEKKCVSGGTALS